MASIRKRNGKWQVQIRRTGQKAACKTFLMRGDALQWGREQEVQADRTALAVNPSLLRRTTLAKLVERYVREITPRKKSALAEAYVLQAFKRHRICKLSLSDLTSSHFCEYRDERLTVLSPAGLRREFAVIRNVLSVAQSEWGIPLKENPAKNVQLKVGDKRRDRRLRGDELQRLIKASKETRNPYLLSVFLFALETGMRRGEILGMVWRNIDLQRRFVKILETKNGHPRIIPLTAAAISLLARHTRESDRVFPTTGNALRLAWERLTKRAGIEDLHFHDLRHEAISRFFERGLTVPEVASISGHRDPRMLLRYAHADQQRLLEKLDKN
ncbi:site-specific integrase [Nitratireductor thuwali]|uniref:Tyrosine recombinase XerC n=1 Tax=Nitratireductor thuwali TaxID=2267699 RepID=A0ABY5MP75_9HYPH|nr:Tyrosine recombinase XerC [Nitratireductor thuwali]